MSAERGLDRSRVEGEQKIAVVCEDFDIIGTRKRIVQTTEGLHYSKCLFFVCGPVLLRFAESAAEESERLMILFANWLAKSRLAALSD